LETLELHPPDQAPQAAQNQRRSCGICGLEREVFEGKNFLQLCGRKLAGSGRWSGRKLQGTFSFTTGENIFKCLYYHTISGISIASQTAIFTLPMLLMGQ
jgi:hypothetical protein